jgi:MFS family permease
MSVRDFVRRSLPLIGFGALLTFFSGFGQTFLLSLYIPDLEKMLGINNTAFGGLYAAATMGSALTLPWIGAWYDRMPLRKYVVLVVSGLGLSLLLLSVSEHILLVLVSFYGLRLFGQGLMSHTAVSSMARYFTMGRGKAISLALLGHPAGEAILPLSITLLMSTIGWRMTLQLSFVLCLLLVLPMAWVLLRRSGIRLRAYAIQAQGADGLGGVISKLSIVRDRRFWVIAPLIFMHGFSITVVLFFQLKLGEVNGWTPAWIAGSIAAFALASATGIVSAGPLVDRFSARSLFPYYAFPYLIGLGILIFFRQPLAYPAALFALGLSNGFGSTINSALMAESYGAGVIGRVRSLFATVIVVSTGLGPILFGLLLDHGWGFPAAYSLVAAGMALAIGNGFRRL